jgi:hypothetical protein
MGARSTFESSLLKEYDILKRDWPVDPDGQFARLEVQCPSCDGIFWVDEEWWIKERRSVIKREIVLLGRSCPYCYKTHRVPDAYWKGKVA